MSSLQAYLKLHSAALVLHHTFTDFTLRMAITIAAISGLFGFAIYGLELYNANEASSFTNMDFGALDPRAIVRDGPGGVLANTFIANAPQVLISLIYFSYNSYFTTMLLGYEWATYAYKRKGLRVTTEAKGAQRSSYSLSLPYKFGLPLIAVGGLMHWLVSQSIFFVEIQVSPARSYSDSISTLTSVTRPALCTTTTPSSIPYKQLDTLPWR